MIKKPSLAAAAFVLPVLLLATPLCADAKKSVAETLADAYEANHTFTMPAAGTIEVAFSPNEGGEALVVKVIDSAKSELRVLSYSFTSAPVTAALLRARKRGVEVRLVADQKNNVSEDHSGKARAALSALATAGADVRTISIYPIHHDKVIVADRQTVELGSFNYSDAAARRNSENVLVNWGNAKLAEVYLQHFERNYRQAVKFDTAYR
jgi:phosphatidylserine/phosphatidylglycerophosphate/cardiolipin synthase-like enzyme